MGDAGLLGTELLTRDARLPTIAEAVAGRDVLEFFEVDVGGLVDAARLEDAPEQVERQQDEDDDDEDRDD